MDSGKDNDWSPHGHVHTDKLENLPLEVNADGNLAYYISFSTGHVSSWYFWNHDTNRGGLGFFNKESTRTLVFVT